MDTEEVSEANIDGQQAQKDEPLSRCMSLNGNVDTVVQFWFQDFAYFSIWNKIIHSARQQGNVWFQMQDMIY